MEIFYKLRTYVQFFWFKLWHTRNLKCGIKGSWGRGCRLKIKGLLQLGDNVHFGQFAYVDIQGSATIGSNTFFTDHVRLVCHEQLLIGSNVLMGSYVSIYDHDHHIVYQDHQSVFTGYTTAPVSIGNNVWIGEKSIVLKGVHIGDNVVIGAGSVVTKDIPSGWMAAGNPCKPLKLLIQCDAG